MVKVNGLEAMCPNFNCDYVYSDATSQVTENALSGLDLTITFTILPTSFDKIQLAGVNCGSIVPLSNT